MFAKVFSRTLILMVLSVFATTAIAAERENTLLINSAFRLDRQGVEIALKQGASINALVGEANKRSALKAAVDGIQLLEYERREAKDRRVGRQTEIDGLKFLQFLVSKGARLSSSDYEILFFPVADGQADIVNYLLSIGADPHAKINSYTPAQLAVRYGRENIYKLLLARKVSPVLPDEALQLRLIKAAEQRNLAESKRLVLQGAKIDQSDSCGETALNASFSIPLFDDEDVSYLIWLLDNGADPRVPSLYKCNYSDKEYVLAKLLRFSLDNLDMLKRQVVVMKMLILAGADVNAVDWDGRTPLHAVAKGGINIEAAEFLLANKADPNRKDIRGRTAVSEAKTEAMISTLVKSRSGTSK